MTLPEDRARLDLEGLIVPHDGGSRYTPFGDPPPEIEAGAGDDQLTVQGRAGVHAAAEVLAMTARHGAMVTVLLPEVLLQLAEKLEDLADHRLVASDREADLALRAQLRTRLRGHGPGQTR